MTNVDLARVEFAFVTINHFFPEPRPNRSRHPGPPLPRPAGELSRITPLGGCRLGPGAI